LACGGFVGAAVFAQGFAGQNDRFDRRGLVLFRAVGDGFGGAFYLVEAGGRGEASGNARAPVPPVAIAAATAISAIASIALNSLFSGGRVEV